MWTELNIIDNFNHLGIEHSEKNNEKILPMVNIENNKNIILFSLVIEIKKFTYYNYNRFLYVIQKNNPIVICNIELIIK